MIQDLADFRLINGAFPHIGKKLAFLWGHPEFHHLIDELQQDRREGERAGFPANVLMALFTLELEHDKAFPDLARPETDIWNPGKAR